MIAAMLHISVATHYCGGKEVASKVSLTSKLANCGMEGSDNAEPLPGLNFDKHCCDDEVTFCGTDNNYVASFNIVPDPCQYNFQILSIPAELTAGPLTGLIPLYTNVNPPGVLMSTDVDLSGICVFRI